jgi:epoxyqueuosine reductase QueG
VNLNTDIVSLLAAEGCHIVGFADLCPLPREVRQDFPYGIAIGLPLTGAAMAANSQDSPALYYEEYEGLNRELGRLATLTASYLVDRGYKALAKTKPTIVETPDHRTLLPHKTVATRAGLGWIGKCAVLVTAAAGSALRLIAVLTDAPLAPGTPVTASRCPARCTLCIDVCPGHAPNGRQWSVGVPREEFFDAEACRTAARARAKDLLDIEETFCGLCISVCPFTKRALGYR